MYLDQNENDIKYGPNQSKPNNPYDGWMGEFFNNDNIEFNVSPIILDKFFKAYWNSNKLFEFMDKNFGLDWYDSNQNGGNNESGYNNNGNDLLPPIDEKPSINYDSDLNINK